MGRDNVDDIHGYSDADCFVFYDRPNFYPGIEYGAYVELNCYNTDHYWGALCNAPSN